MTSFSLDPNQKRGRGAGLMAESGLITAVVSPLSKIVKTNNLMVPH